MARPGHARVIAYLVGIICTVALAGAVAEGAGEGAGEGVPPFDAGDVPIVGDWVGGVVDGHTSQDTVPFVNDDGSVEAPKIISKQSVDEVKVQGVGDMTGDMVTAQDSDGHREAPPYDETKVPIVGKMVNNVLNSAGDSDSTSKTIPFFSNGIPFVDDEGNADFPSDDSAQSVGAEQPALVASSGVEVVGRAWEAIFAVGVLSAVALVLRKVGQRRGPEANAETEGLVACSKLTPSSVEYGARASAPAVTNANAV